MMRHLAAIKQHAKRRVMRRLRVLAQPTSALLLALCFAFAEPLACIIHCQIYVPWLLRNQHVHQHAHTPKVAAASFAPPSGAAFVAEPAALPTNANCFQATGGNSLPAPAEPPSPVHEVILVTLLLLAGIAALFGVPARAPPPPRSCDNAPLTPPPRCFLA